MTPIQKLATTLFSRRCRGVVSANARLSIWKSLPLELSANVCPFIGVVDRRPIPANYEGHYYPGDQETLAIDDYEVTLDVIIGDNQNLVNAKNTLPLLTQPNPADSNLTMAHIWFAQAGHDFYDARQYDLAFRCFLNSCRILPPDGDIISPEMRCNIGKCCIELGDFLNAGVEYLSAAEKFIEAARDDRAADCFERSALCWEASQETSQFQIGTENGDYNSTECSRRAKCLYLTIGDYLAASRCAIFEQDCILKWQKTSASIPRRIMRWTWLYGESPIYAFGSAVVVLFTAATSFFLWGYKRGDDVVEYDLGGSLTWESVGDFGDAMYLAAVTISTLGYGDLSPASGLSKLLAGVTSLSGIVLAAMFLVALQRRYVGR